MVTLRATKRLADLADVARLFRMHFWANDDAVKLAGRSAPRSPDQPDAVIRG